MSIMITIAIIFAIYCTLYGAIDNYYPTHVRASCGTLTICETILLFMHLYKFVI